MTLRANKCIIYNPYGITKSANKNNNERVRLSALEELYKHQCGWQEEFSMIIEVFLNICYYPPLSGKNKGLC